MKALTDISLTSGSTRAIIGPNGAGKSSMLNVINGVYHPQQGTSRFTAMSAAHGPDEAAANGIARTFQNIALFRGMTVLDNIMTGRNLKMREFSRAGALVRARLPRGARESAEGGGGDRFPQIQPSARRRSDGCLTDCRNGRAGARRWPRSRRCCCSMSRWRA